MNNKDKNPFEGIDHGDMTDEEKKARGIETDAERDERVSKQKTEAKKTAAKKTAKPKAEKKPKAPKAAKPKKEAKPKAPKTPRAKKPAKPKKESSRAPRVVLSEKQLAEPREVIRILPAVRAMVEKYAKQKDLDVNSAADKLITTAWGRIHALQRYNEK